MKPILKPTIIAMSLFATACAGSGEPREQSSGSPLAIDNALTAAEIAAGVLTPEVMWKMGRIGEFVLSPDGTKVVYGRTDYNMAEDRGVTTLWLQSTDGGQPTRITGYDENASGPVWSADGASIRYLSDRGGTSQIWTIAPDGTGARQLSSIDGDVEYFGVSPAENRVWYVQRVKVAPRTTAELYPDLDRSAARVYDELMVRHWNRWTDGTHLHIFVTDLGAGGAIAAGRDIMTGEPYDAPMEPYFDAAEIAWNNAGTALAYTCKKMGETEYAVSTDSDVYLYDVASGTTINTCKPAGGNAHGELTGTPQSTSTFGSGPMPGYDKYPVFSPDDTRIAIRSMARAGNEADRERLFIYEIATGAFTDLTADFDQSVMNVTWAADGASLDFIAPWFGTHQLFRTDLAGNIARLTDGDHDIGAASHAAGRTVVSLTTMSLGAELHTVSADGTLTPLTSVNGEIYAAIRSGKVEKRTIRTTDGKDMLTWVFFPPDFDPARKYPALLYCQGGPQSTLGWSYRWNFQLMAAQGYIVVAPCRRGVPGFGQEWTDQISGDYAGQNMRDLLGAIDAVSSEPYVDASRLGCVGASYGGYTAFYLAGTHQKRFKAFIAHCGIFNFESMYGHTEELFFVNNDYGGSYWSDDAVARRSYAHSPHKFVKNWDTPILIITGLNDFRIPYTQSLEAHTAARLMGVPSRLVAFENEAHQVFRPQNSLAWNREFFGWLDKYVKSPR